MVSFERPFRTFLRASFRSPPASSTALRRPRFRDAHVGRDVSCDTLEASLSKQRAPGARRAGDLQRGMARRSRGGSQSPATTAHRAGLRARASSSIVCSFPTA